MEQALSVGVHTLTASVNDPQGLQGSDVVTFTILANTAPTVTITSPEDGGSAIAGTLVDLIATADDAESGDLTADITWNSSIDGDLGTGPGGTVLEQALSVGVHTLTASVNDPQGLPGSDVVTFEILENTAPTVTITSPEDGGSAIVGTPVELIATADDAESGELTTEITWTSSIDGDLGEEPGGSLTLTDLSIGEHTLTATVNDPQGLPASDIVIFTVPEPAAAASSVAALGVIAALAARRRERSRDKALRM